MKKALITGITGQDGSYLAELLLQKGYEVHGLVRHVALESPGHRLGRISHVLDKINLHSGSLESYASIFSVVEKVRPDECYHLAAVQAPTELSIEHTQAIFAVNINGTFHLLASLKAIVPQCRVYFAGSSEMFGKVRETPQTEATPFHPRSPYGISKVTGFDITRNYREAHNIFACSGILFNHESERRGIQFVTRKITDGAAKIKLGLANELKLGNLDAKRDWGYAPEYVEAMWLMLQPDVPEDFVIATGQTHSVREFVEAAFQEVNLDWRQYVKIDESFKRPAEVNLLIGDSSKAKEKLGWQPRTDFAQLAQKMVQHDLERLKKINNVQ